MANLTLNIPDLAIPRIVSAVRAELIDNSLSDVDIVRKFIYQNLKKLVLKYELNQEIIIAESNVSEIGIGELNE